MNNKDNKVSVLFMLFSILFCVCLIAANVLETKQIAFGSISLTGGLIVFPVSYIINDCVCEVWGYKKTRMLIWIGFAMNFFFVTLGAICDVIPGAPYWTNNDGFHQIFGLAPRIAFASFLAFICGSFVNAYIMSKMKLSSGGKNFSLRAVVSTIFGESVDSIIFFPLALWGVVPTEELPWLMLWQVILKTAYEIVALPLTIRLVRYVKQHEKVDTYDNDVNYSIWRVLSI
ncbi:MAG: queuosine precursor transporter [Prevotella shahii]|uniref:queuosine precursor transporter n=1 Tax=Hoylesella shahii TaxID=228603 RepID=UPI001CACD84B|nr:queuosine precursor transporter [Hoylesella shahii]MBF1568911.1 queuosine precursor transporter [Hoylesella shahii]